MPECSLVVAFDEVPNPTAFVQMRGRARNHDGGSFVIFAGDTDALNKIFSLELGAARFESGAAALAVRIKTRLLIEKCLAVADVLLVIYISAYRRSSHQISQIASSILNISSKCQVQELP